MSTPGSSRKRSETVYAARRRAAAESTTSTGCGVRKISRALRVAVTLMGSSWRTRLESTRTLRVVSGAWAAVKAGRARASARTVSALCCCRDMMDYPVVEVGLSASRSAPASFAGSGTVRIPATVFLRVLPLGLQGQPGQLGHGVQPQLPHQALPVRLHRAGAQAQRSRDLLISAALGDALEHLPLP